MTIHYLKRHMPQTGCRRTLDRQAVCLNTTRNPAGVTCRRCLGWLSDTSELVTADMLRAGWHPLGMKPGAFEAEHAARMSWELGGVTSPQAVEAEVARRTAALYFAGTAPSAEHVAAAVLAELEATARFLEQWAQAKAAQAKLGARVVGTNEVRQMAEATAKRLRRLAASFGNREAR